MRLHKRKRIFLIICRAAVLLILVSQIKLFYSTVTIIERGSEEYRPTSADDLVHHLDQSNKVPQKAPPKAPTKLPQKVPQEVPQEMRQEVPQKVRQEVPQKVPQEMPQEVGQEVPQKAPKKQLRVGLTFPEDNAHTATNDVVTDDVMPSYFNLSEIDMVPQYEKYINVSLNDVFKAMPASII